jgi:hypothetical protein
VGRPSIFTPELGANICARIAIGESLRAIEADDGMPAKTTILRWLSQDEAFRDQYARAREESADVLAQEIVEIADDVSGDANRDRLRVDARKWVAAKLKPKKYGDATLHKHADPDGNALKAVVNVTISGS